MTSSSGEEAFDRRPVGGDANIPERAARKLQFRVPIPPGYARPSWVSQNWVRAMLFS